MFNTIIEANINMDEQIRKSNEYLDLLNIVDEDFIQNGRTVNTLKQICNDSINKCNLVKLKIESTKNTIRNIHNILLIDNVEEKGITLIISNYIYEMEKCEYIEEKKQKQKQDNLDKNIKYVINFINYLSFNEYNKKYKYYKKMIVSSKVSFHIGDLQNDIEYCDILRFVKYKREVINIKHNIFSRMYHKLFYKIN